jgi:6-phosphogluconolactonase
MNFALLFLLIIALFNDAAQQSTRDKSYNLVIGTYTNKDKSNGIHVYSFDSKTGDLSHRSTTLGIENPSFLAVSPDNKNIYSVSEVGNGNAKISSYLFNGKSGELTLLNMVSAGGDGPCHISIDAEKQIVFVSNYGSGSLTNIKLDRNGLLTNNIQVIQHFGSSVDRLNQSKPHVHSAILSPDQQYLLAADLGTDKIHIYQYEKNKLKPLTAAKVPFVKIKGGSGPRHLAFHPIGKYAYSILELTASIAVFDYEKGKLTVKQYISMLPVDFKGGVEAADIHISTDGKFLYASNRSDGNDIVIFSISRDGTLTYVGGQTAEVSTPRNFVIDPTGNFLLVANMDGNNVVVFRRDRKTGMVTSIDKQVKVDMPVCLKFITIN